MIDRRKFIATSSLAAASLMTMESGIFAASGSQKLKKIGFIEGLIHKELKGDWKAALKKAVDFGFTEIEVGSYLGDSAQDFLSYCKGIGLKPFAGFINFTDKTDELKKNLDSLAELQVEYAINYWPWLTGGPFTLENCKQSAAMLNKIGEMVKKYGLTFCWHNHNKEFIAMEDGLPFDYLMKNTDKDLVKCELDIYWVVKGDADPLGVLKKHSGRIKILHVKDMAQGPAQDFECPGSGIIDFPTIFREAANQGIEHYIVERDNCPDGMACLKSSGAYLKNLTF